VQSQLAREESVGGQVGGWAQRMQEVADCLTIFGYPRRLGCLEMRPNTESLGTFKDLAAPSEVRSGEYFHNYVKLQQDS